MTEADIQRDIIAYVEECNGIAIRINSGRARINVRMAPSGTPDLLAVLPDGRVLWIEVKRAGGQLRTEQATMHTRLRYRKQRVLVASSVDDVAAEIYRPGSAFETEHGSIEIRE
jgi:hypothetical protein